MTNARQPSVEVIRGKAKQQTNQPNKKKSEQVPKVWRTKGTLDKPHISDCPIGPETAQEPITQDVVDATDILERDNESPVGGQAKEQLDKGNTVPHTQQIRGDSMGHTQDKYTYQMKNFLYYKRVKA